MYQLLLVYGCIVFYVGVGSVSQRGKDKSTRLVKQARRMIGKPRQNFKVVYADLLITKLTDVMDDVSHSLHDQLAIRLISRSGLMCLSLAVTGRCLSSFVPQAIRIHNANFQKGTIFIDV